MRRTLPSLMALQCFDAAVRHLSFTRAAEELNLTQSAVSRQIRALEDFLGRPLFERVKQRLVLTSAGEGYAAAIRDVLDRAEAATLQLMAHGNEGGVLRLAVLPTFGSRWLVPRLGDFSRRHPDVELDLVTQVRPFDFDKEAVDAAIHFGPALWPGATCHRLMGEVIVPVCAPALLKEWAGLADPRELAGFTLLQHTTRPQAWNEWLHAVGVDDVDGMKGPRFEQIQMVIQAAIAGLGVAVLPRFLVEDELADGRLAVAVNRPVNSQHAYYLVHPATKSDLYPVRAFRDWLLEQVGA
ncbi:transcriptional regulator GcvA [Crenobacter cavernae]|uniref:Transcriptional regulator GcvA n=1 Tax=Crenobacter cavernae TaxID=2290923 RepID=A0ABY0FGV0_9NEIS|nr:transcriptional regulator GcvA [Crenobacter cavernae]RXZ45620.1 transcriptional regulator GcvA [Crenobacter cavernae]